MIILLVSFVKEYLNPQFLLEISRFCNKEKSATCT